MSVCILPVKGRTGRKFLLEITSENNFIFNSSAFVAFENNGYLGESTDGVIWKSIGIKGWIKAIMAHIVKKQGML